MTELQSSRSVRPIQLLPFSALMLFGGLLNLAILLWNYSSDATSENFVRQPSFAYWLFFIGIQGVFWWPLAVFLVPLVRNGMAQTSSISEHFGAIALSLLTFASGFVFYRLAQTFGWIHEPSMWPLFGHTIKMSILTALGLVPAVLAVLGIVYASAAAGKVSGASATAVEVGLPSRIQGLLESRKSFDLSLNALGLLLSASTLATAALRNATISFGKVCAERKIACPRSDASLLTGFPLEMVLMFGLCYSFVLLLVVVPTGLRIQNSCDNLIRDAAGDIPDSVSDLQAWVDRKESVRSALGMGGGLWTTIKDAILILGPILSALLSTLIPD